MADEELRLWNLYERARKDLILFYLPLVDILAKRIALDAGGANWEDLRQDGAIGLMKAIVKFRPSKGTPFKAFANNYIRGAIFDSSELTRDLKRRQEEICRRTRQIGDQLRKTLQRNPTIEEVAEKSELTVRQIENALDAKGLAFAEALPDAEDLSSWRAADTPRPESAILLEELLSQLSAREQAIIIRWDYEGKSPEQIAEELEIIPKEVVKIRQRAISNVIKIRERALKRLRNRFGVAKKGVYDDDRRARRWITESQANALDRQRVGRLLR